MKKCRFVHVCAYLSLAISITMLVLWCCNVGGFTVVSLDSFVGVIVALLAITTTFAIGWQIYNSFELKNKIEKMESLEEKYKDHDHKMKQIQSRSLHLIGANMGDFALNNSQYTSAFDYYLKSLNSSLLLDKPINLETLINRMENAANSMQHNTLCDSLEDIRDYDKRIRSSKNYLLIKPRYELLYNTFTSKVIEAE